MSQVTPINSNGTPFTNTGNNIRRLFVETGYGYLEIASSKGSTETERVLPSKHYALSDKVLDGSVSGRAIGRIVEDYTPPSPSMKFTELKIANAPSHIHSTGKASYKISLRIMIPDKVLMADFLFYSGNTFKFYDEKGSIFLGCVTESLEIKRHEGGQLYDVKLALTAVRKDQDSSLEKVQYTDLVGYDTFEMETNFNVLWGGTLNYTFNNGTYNVSDSIIYQASEGLSGIARTLNQWYSLGKYFSTTVAGTKLIFKPKKVEYGTPATPLTFTAPIQNGETFNTVVVKIPGEHWAKTAIENAAHAGIVATLDRYGNYVYVFRPNVTATRAETVAFINRMRKYLERMIR